MTPPRPVRWLDLGGFALGIMVEALAELRRSRPAPAVPARAPARVLARPVRRRPRPARRPSPRRLRPPTA